MMTKEQRTLNPHVSKFLGRSRLRKFLILLSLLLGWGMAQLFGLPAASLRAQTPLAQNPASQAPASIELDPVPARYQLGQELYRDNCATCHLAIPPAVLPTETWRQVLQDSQHYGRQLQPLVDPTRLLVWNYLVAFSRPQLRDEEVPYRIQESRYFRALHPQVNFSSPVTLSSCVSCHPGASEGNFRRLTPNWEKAP